MPGGEPGANLPCDMVEAHATVLPTTVHRRDAAARSRNGRTPDHELIESADMALGVLAGKWKVHLLCSMARGIHRHSRLLDCLPGGSKKVMTDALRGMERDGLVDRRVYAEVPPRVEYRLTQLGWTTTDLLVSLAAWGDDYGGDVLVARRSATHPSFNNGERGSA
jgi:DNA-binding HxlR family transcriptional regulator